MAARMAMMAITTSNSIKVNAAGGLVRTVGFEFRLRGVMILMCDCIYNVLYLGISSRQDNKWLFCVV
jgi:hypothetical protein